LFIDRGCCCCCCSCCGVIVAAVAIVVVLINEVHFERGFIVFNEGKWTCGDLVVADAND